MGDSHIQVSSFKIHELYSLGRFMSINKRLNEFKSFKKRLEEFSAILGNIVNLLQRKIVKVCKCNHVFQLCFYIY